jgi:hypothetical protein
MGKISRTSLVTCASIATIISVCLTIIGLVAAYGAWLFPRTPLSSPPSQPSPAVTTEEFSVTPTHRSVTTTLTPTQPPYVTSTPKPYYQAEEEALITTDISASLVLTDLNGGISCYPNPGWVVIINVQSSSNDYFYLRYDPGRFSATDDLGTEYPLYGAGVEWCNETPGLKMHEMYPNSGARFFLGFSGEIPAQATYLVITAEYINGVKLVFRRHL